MSNEVWIHGMNSLFLWMFRLKLQLSTTLCDWPGKGKAVYNLLGSWNARPTKRCADPSHQDLPSSPMLSRMQWYQTRTVVCEETWPPRTGVLCVHRYVFERQY
jgi:hypothetical protein